MCYYRHHAHDDPFLYPGLQDITAHVDFTALALAGVASELSLSGYTTQGMFLLNCGLAEHIENEQDISKKARIKQLILPQHMGENFKAMAFSRGLDIELRGFFGVDHRHKLSLL
jgi:SAM-dependent MidA family methyltransferase